MGLDFIFRFAAVVPVKMLGIFFLYYIKHHLFVNSTGKAQIYRTGIVAVAHAKGLYSKTPADASQTQKLPVSLFSENLISYLT